MVPTETNWAGNLTYRAAAVHHPASVAEVHDLVARLPRVRALGTRHSFSAVADRPGGDLVSLDAVPPEITVDPAAMTVSVTGGTRYGELAVALHTEGFALHNTGSLPHISVAGATATGTHGSGDANGILSTAVVALEVVRADGTSERVDRDDPALAAMAVGLGMFGVITRVVLEIQPTYQVRQDVYVGAPWDGVLEAFDEIMAGAYSVSLLGDPGATVLAQIWQKTRVGAEPPAPAPRSLHGGRWYDDADVPGGTGLNPRAGLVGPWSERLPHFRLDAPPSVGGDELQTEYFVERRHAVNALRTLRSLGGRISPHLHATEIRTAASDALWLSPVYGRDSLCIGFTWRKHPTEVMALLPVIEAALRPYEPRPHWGKLFVLNDDDLARRFPRLPEFLELTATYDPVGKFSNAFIEALQP
jgi:alditol oxidase